MRVRQATITDGHLIATWLDRELLACMGAMPVGTAEEGKQRSELRTSIGSQTIHYPAGNTWAHALDAEPMALATDGTTVVFDLYRRGCTASASTPTNTGACRHQRGPIRSGDQETRRR